MIKELCDKLAGGEGDKLEGAIWGLFGQNSVKENLQPKPKELTPSERAQLLQTVEVFKGIYSKQPLDYEVLNILKEAYYKLGQQEKALEVSMRLATVYQALGQTFAAADEYGSILTIILDYPGALAAYAKLAGQSVRAGVGIL